MTDNQIQPKTLAKINIVLILKMSLKMRDIILKIAQFLALQNLLNKLFIYYDK